MSSAGSPIAAQTSGDSNDIALLTLAEFEKHLNYLREVNERNHALTLDKFSVVQRDTNELQEKLRGAERKLDAANRRIAVLESESASLVSQREQIKSEYTSFIKQSNDDIAALRQKNDELSLKLRQEAVESAKRDETFRALTDDMIKTKLTAAQQADMVNMEKRKVAQLTRALEAANHEGSAHATGAGASPAAAPAPPSESSAKSSLAAAVGKFKNVVGHVSLFDNDSDESPEKVNRGPATKRMSSKPKL